MQRSIDSHTAIRIPNVVIFLYLIIFIPCCKYRRFLDKYFDWNIHIPIVSDCFSDAVARLIRNRRLDGFVYFGFTLRFLKYLFENFNLLEKYLHCTKGWFYRCWIRHWLLGLHQPDYSNRLSVFQGMYLFIVSLLLKGGIVVTASSYFCFPFADCSIAYFQLPKCRPVLQVGTKGRKYTR